MKGLSRAELEEKVCRIMSEMFELPREELKLEAKIFEELGLDSIDAVDLVVKVQELTGRRVDEADLRRVRTVRDVVDIAEAHLQKVA